MAAMQNRFARLHAVMLLLAAMGGRAMAGAPNLHVPSPDWRDQVIYFVMTDRFDDGDRGNSDQGAGEFDPADPSKYHGGDLRGIERRLDYIRGLGATAVWITPPVSNLWWNPTARFAGYHGYWAENFVAVDPHNGSLADYQRLSGKLHDAGMYLVQDIVVNHVGDYFDVDAAGGARLKPDSRGRTAPTQSPFDLNDPRDPAHRAAGIYHWTPPIRDFNDPRQVLDFQLAGLDDLATANPRVRAALRDSYAYWIREVGVDAFRVDTAYHVPAAFFEDFLFNPDPRHPGVFAVAESTGRGGFHVFGEGFSSDRPYEDEQARRIDRYMRGPDGRPRMPGMLNFPLYATTADVFARGRPTAELGYRIGSMMAVHRAPHLMPTFVDNHDVDRFLAGGTHAGLKQALLLTMTLPGIPTIYYGTEQGFTEQRAAMFAAGQGSGGRDRFDVDAPLYRFIQRATRLRREHRLFSRGTPTVLLSNAAGPGVLAYRMRHGAESAIVVFNSADHDTLLAGLDTGLAPGTVLQGLFAIEGEPRDVVAGLGGQLAMRLPARSGFVWRVTRENRPVAASAAKVTLEGLPAGPVRGDVALHGRATGVGEFLLVVDGDLATARTVRPGADGRWQATLDTGDMIDPVVPHEVVAWAEATGALSAAQRFHVSRDWRVLADVADPLGDDAGPRGDYRYPSDPGWGANRQLDIEHLRVLGAGGALRLELQMRGITTPWKPANGFDHVAFTIFIEVPGQAGGAAVMPMQNGLLPDGMRWHYRLRAHGWSNALFSADGASATSEGTPIAPASDIRVDAGSRTISFSLPASALGHLASLSGVRVYATTWDYDGGYRSLTPAPQPMGFGGGDGALDPLVMDATGVVRLE